MFEVLYYVVDSSIEKVFGFRRKEREKKIKVIENARGLADFSVRMLNGLRVEDGNPDLEKDLIEYKQKAADALKEAEDDLRRLNTSC